MAAPTKAQREHQQAVVRFQQAAINILSLTRYTVDPANLPLHYTSLAVIDSLIEAGFFRIYNAGGMHDPSEGRHLLARMRMKLSDYQIRQLLSANGGHEMFISSLVLNSNNRIGDDLMWRTYGDGRKGVALAFRDLGASSFSDFIEHLAQKEDITSTDQLGKTPIVKQEMFLGKVCYGTSDMQDEIDNLGEQLRKINVDWLSEQEKYRLSRLLNFVRYMFKQDLYRREEEARVLVLRPLLHALSTRDFSRSYLEIPGFFRPEALIVGPDAWRPEICKQWLESQSWVKGNQKVGEKAITIKCSDREE
ncbi:MAG: DUF2971 domain-containing protein [Betaproteobacteria bacterium]|nr:DUF2971 domain-containing protein [Betaproteobacteria bacterium]